MEYILFIHTDTMSEVAAQEWGDFIEAASRSGMFRGGSEIGSRILLGGRDVSDITETIGGFMRFETADLEQLQTLLDTHPVLLHGGSLELCEMPQSP